MEMKVTGPVRPPINASSPLVAVAAEVVSQAKARPAIDPQTADQTKPREAAPEQLQKTVDELQRKVQASTPNLQFSIDHDTGKTVIKVVDTNTNEVIRQLPPEEMLQLAKEIDRMRGLLLHKKG